MEIPLNATQKSKSRQSKGIGHVSIVDDDDYERLNLSAYHWSLAISKHFKGETGYAYATDTKTGKRIALHRLIMNAPVGIFVDHINGDPLDNRKHNLRLANHSQSLANRAVFKTSKSGYKGVTYNKKYKKWKMSMASYYDSPEEAARMYDRLAEIVFGEYARPNFPDEKNS